MGEVIEAAVLAIALARRIDQRQVARLALRVGRIDFAREIELLQRERDLLRKADADKAAGGHRVAVANEPDSFRGGDDLALLGSSQIGQSRMLAHARSSRTSSKPKARFARILAVVRFQASAFPRVSVAK